MRSTSGTIAATAAPTLLKRAVGAVLTAILLAQGITTARAADTDCTNTDAALEYWRPIRQQAPDIEEPADNLAIALLPCLASPDPELRDQIGYELFTYWLRGEKLTVNTRRTLLRELSTTMASPPAATPDNSVFARSFSALVLAEIMRSDANQPFMTATERQTVLDQGIQSLRQENDYRGLDTQFGWVHPVAHLSDLLWRFALHTDLSTTQAESILDGIRAKVAPAGIFYKFNESDRLARVITTLITRELIAPEKVELWITSFETPSSMEKWSEAFASPRGMAELHNTKLFVRALADQLAGADIDPAISGPLEALVQGFTQLI